MSMEILLDQIKNKALKTQRGKLKNMEGRYVERDGKIFLIVGMDYKKNKVIVSDTKTPINNVVKFSINSFLSKAIVEIK